MKTNVLITLEEMAAMIGCDLEKAKHMLCETEDGLSIHEQRSMCSLEDGARAIYAIQQSEVSFNIVLDYLVAAKKRADALEKLLIKCRVGLGNDATGGDLDR